MRVSGHTSEKQFMTYVHKDATIDIEILANQIAQIPVFERAA